MGHRASKKLTAQDDDKDSFGQDSSELEAEEAPLEQATGENFFQNVINNEAAAATD